MNYYSQFKQDLLVDRIFQFKRNGSFVDIGAHDGIIFSNTYFLEKYRDWTGICIEPNSECFNDLINKRNCIAILGCVSGTTGIKKFSKVKGKHNMLSGLKENMSPEHIERLKSNIMSDGGEIIDIDVNCYTLNEILEKNGLFHVDYCSIDTEGSELDILKSFDFQKFDIKMFSIENVYILKEIRSLMKVNGYKLLKIQGCDEIYIKKKKFSCSLFLLQCYLLGFIKKNPIATKYRRLKKSNLPS